MEEYMENYFTIENSTVFNGDTINVLEYRANDGGLHGYCIRCGKPLRRHWWRVQTADDDAVYGDIGAEGVKKLTGQDTRAGAGNPRQKGGQHDRA